MKDSLQWLLGKFPYFLDKNPDSNFYKSTHVLNENFRDLYQDLFKVHLSHRLEKRILLYKEQSVENDYSINFIVNIPHLKRVTCYKNGTVIYTESYEYEDEVNTFFYSHDDTSNNVIPSDKYHITVETYEEYTLSKGFPENDTLIGDMFDHDKSLDELGALYDIPRKNYTYPEDVNYGNTEPAYNNRATEDDYHYMNRILGYITNMMDTPLPVLEVWKLYGIPLSEISLINRERYLCKMYSSEKHGGDDWSPFQWEHKDTMGCFWPEPIFFFVNVDNESPVYGQKIHFSFTFMDMYGEEHNEGYLIDAYLDGEPLSTGIDPKTIFEFDTTGADDEHPLVFKFIANPIDERYEILESDDLFIIIKGCNSADWFVATNGSDSNDGSINYPFKTLDKALSMVEGSRNVITLKEGTFPITHEEVIDTSTSIISCHGAVIRNDKNYDFFRIMQDCSLYLMGITLKHKCCEMYGTDTTFMNRNVTENPVFLRINPEIMCKLPVSIVVDDIVDSIYAHTDFSVEGTLYDADDSVPVSGEVIDLVSGGTVLDTDTTDSNGVYSFTHRLDSIGTQEFKLNHEESQRYCMGETSFSVLVEAMPTTLTCAMDSTVLFGDELTLAYDLVDYYGDDLTVGTVKLMEGTSVLASVTAGETLHYTPETVGEHSYHLEWEHDNTYVPSATEPVTVNVRRFETRMVASSEHTQYLLGESVTVNGILTDELGNELTGQTVRLYDGDTLLSTQTTDNNGEVNYTSSNLSLGLHSLVWKFTATGKYDSCDSNLFRLRIVPVSPDVKLYLSSNGDVSGSTIPLKVYATDDEDNPISTSFKLVDAGSVECGQYPSTSYTTGSDGYWTGNYNSSVLIACGVLYLQAVDSTDTYIVSNVLDVYSSGRYSSSITLVSSESSVSVGESFTLSGVLSTEEVTGASVKILEGTDVIATVTVDGSTGAYSYTNTESVAGDYSYKAVYDGDRYHEPAESSTVSVSVGKVATVTSLSASSSSIHPSESLTLSGTVTNLDSGTVKLYDGSSLVNSVSVTNGSFSKVLTGLSLGSHSFKAVFEGDSGHTGSESSSVSVTVAKISTSTSISASSSSITPTDTLTLSGSVTGASTGSVKLYDGSSLIETVSLSSGAYSKNLTGLSVGTHSFKAVYDGDTDHTGSESSSVSVSVNDYSILLSASDIMPDTGEVVTLTALLENDGVAVSGATVSFNIGGSTSTATTSNSGVATVSYTATGSAGNVQVTASYSGVSDSLVIHDGFLPTDILVASDLTKYERSSHNFEVTVYDFEGQHVGEGHEVVFHIHGVDYNRYTNSSGVIVLTIGLPPDVYPITSTTVIDGVTVTVENTVTVLPRIIPEKIYYVKIYGESLTIPVTILDGEGDPDPDETVIFSVNGVTYNRTTDSNGVARLNFPNLMEGTFITNVGCGELTTTPLSVKVVQMHTYNLTLASDKQTIDIGEAVTFSGVLTDNDVILTGESVQLYDGDTLLDTVTTDDTGTYTKTISTLTQGNHSLKAKYGSKESSVVTVRVGAPDYSLSVTGTKSILSYADSESCTVTATLTDGGSAVAGETLSYVIKHGTTTIDSGSDTTDSSGQISFTYASTGVGDVTVEVDYSTLLQEIFVIQDCIDYQPLTSNADQSKWTIPSAVTSSSIFGYTTNGWKFGNASSYSRIIHNTELTFPFSIEYTIMELNSTSSGDGILNYIYSNGSTPNYGIGRASSYWWMGTLSNRVSTTFTAGDVVRIEFKTSSIDLYVNDVKLMTATHSVSSPTNVEFHTGTNRSCRIKDFKIKAL